MANLVTKSAVKAHEKSNFAQKCNLLSQYFKEKGSFGDISLGMNGKIEAKGPETSNKSPATTLNLLPNMETSDETLRQKAVASTNVTTADFFPQLVCFGSQNPIEDATNKDDLRKSSTTVPGPAQMTIFYNGKVIVFDDFPADKAKEIMALASMGSTNNPTGAPVSNNAQERLQLHPQVAKASLHRFFAKRKDRAAARAPYQVNSPSQAPPKHEEERNSSWLDLEGQSSKQLELKL